MESISAKHQLGPDHHRISEYATDIVETLLVRPAGSEDDSIEVAPALP